MLTSHQRAQSRAEQNHGAQLYKAIRGLLQAACTGQTLGVTHPDWQRGASRLPLLCS